jgi:hypothetical protein
MRVVCLLALLVTPAAAAPEVEHLEVTPTATDSAITSPNDVHEVFSPDGAGNGKLLVFLPGTDGKPANAQRFLVEAARLGYHAVGLDYPDSEAAGSCKQDLACYAPFRDAIVNGSNAKSPIQIAAADSITNRLTKLVAYLAKSDKSWAVFLDANGALDYRSIAFAGLSQGGGHAAFIAKRHEVARVIMFSSVTDAANKTSPPTPATWIGDKSATPIDRFYGFDHDSDFAHAKVIANWTALGLDKLGKRTSVDGAHRPFHSHELSTSVSQPNGLRAHTSVVGDRATPLDHDVPVYLEAWDALLLD